MFHRRLISEAQLRQLLKEADFAPEWVDRIIDVAYDPLTRVDVRRMRAFGILTKQEVVDAYQDIGYNEVNARRLSDFTEAEIAASKHEAAATNRDLTRGDLVGAYADGILNRAAATSHLESIGYDAAETALILDREDIRVMRAERKETRSAIVDQAVAGIIDRQQAQDKLSRAGYTDDEIKSAFAEIGRKLDAMVKEPSKADLDKFVKHGAMTEADYRSELLRMGYAAKWVDAYVAVLAVKDAAIG
jgi:hypothetical protein